MLERVDGIFIITPVAEDDRKKHPSFGETKSHSFDEAIDIVGFGRTGWQVFLVSALVMLAVINETMGISIIIPAARCDLNLSATDKGMLTGVSFAGIILTSHFWGYLADTKGRKNVIIVSLMLTSVCSLMSSMAATFGTMVVLRLFAGMCISAPSATIYAYLGEFVRTDKRTLMISFASVSVGLSSVFVGSIGWAVLSQNWSVLIPGLMIDFRPWRLLLVLFSLPGAIGAVWMYFLPESPKFYLAQGLDDKALAVLRQMYVETHPGRGLQDCPVKRITPEVGEAGTTVHATGKGLCAVLRDMWDQTVPLFSRPHLLYFSVCCALQFGMFFVSAGMGLWYPEIVNQMTTRNQNGSETICEALKGVDSPDEDFVSYENNFLLEKDALELCDDHVSQDAFVCLVVLGSVYSLLYLIMTAFLKCMNRGYILVSHLIISGVSGVLLVFVNQTQAVLVLICFLIIFAGSSISLVNGAAVSLFPTNIRATAVCLSLMMGRLGSVAGTNFIGLILEDHCHLTFALFAGCSLLGAILALILPSR
ncbi:synaptic vesicle glycoprotein 2B [Uranotaenia lowii]|uniref:synaptic vesicle glycoprotein 2B n=1 Tax=Uranotaenia lowii TaxID=190385 RepID=UPI002479C923|nr:synaptic vesicle glycoprotein 2B [Uranotaenia lowii]